MLPDGRQSGHRTDSRWAIPRRGKRSRPDRLVPQAAIEQHVHASSSAPSTGGPLPRSLPPDRRSMSDRSCAAASCSAYERVKAAWVRPSPLAGPDRSHAAAHDAPGPDPAHPSGVAACSGVARTTSGLPPAKDKTGGRR